MTPIPDTPESPTPENRGQSVIFQPYDLSNPSTLASYDNPPPPHYFDSGKWIAKIDIAPPSGTP